MVTHCEADTRVSRKDYQRHLREIWERIESALVGSELSESQKKDYRAALENIIDKLRPPALARLHRFALGFRFYRSHIALTDAVKLKYPDLDIASGRVLKGMFDRDGTLHMDGGGRLQGRNARLAEFQAHEIAHAIDGHRELSGTVEWQEAWQAEIANGGLLGTNSAKSPHEGWGDFGMLVLGSDISAKEITEVLPKAYTFWHKRGLL
jgi:hypothetical protein